MASKSLIEYTFEFYAKAVDFEGRNSRQNYWWTTLGVLISYVLPILIMVIGSIISKNNDMLNKAIFISAIAFTIIFSLWISIGAVSQLTRRLHDIGMSGWFQLLIYVPAVGILFWIYMVFKEGDRFTNQYGDIPQD